MEGQVEGVKTLPLAVGHHLSAATSSNVVAGYNVGIMTIGQNAVINSDACRGSGVISARPGQQLARCCEVLLQ